MSVISDIKLYPVNGHPTIKANGSIVLYDSVLIRIKVMNGKNGLFVSFPGRQGKSKDDANKTTWYSDVIIVDEDLRTAIQKQVVTHFNKQFASNGATTHAPQTTSNIPF